MEKHLYIGFIQGMQNKEIPRFEWNFTKPQTWLFLTSCILQENSWWQKNMVACRPMRLSLTRKYKKLLQRLDSTCLVWDPLVHTQDKAITSSLVILAIVSFAGVPQSTRMRVRWSMSGQKCHVKEHTKPQQNRQ